MLSSANPDVATMRRIANLSEFAEGQLLDLAGQLEVENARKGDCLIPLGCSEAFSFYLIEGAVEVIARDGRARQVESSDGQLQPIAQIRPSMFEVVACDKVRYLKVYPEMLVDYAQQLESGNKDFDVMTVEQTEEENQLTMQLMQDLVSGQLKLPSLPDVAMKIQQAFADDAVDAESICDVVGSDPAIAAKIIMISNSALYAGQAKIETLKQAVVRLGFETTRKLVLTYAVKELFRDRNVAMRAQMKTLWKHSQQVASLARLLAQKLDGFDPEQAQLAGLVHDLGEVALLQYAQDNLDVFEDPKMLLAAIKSLTPQITGMLLNQWNFGAEYVAVGEESESWFRNPSEKADLCDLVLIAQYHAFIGKQQIADLPPVSKLPAFAKLGMATLTPPDIIAFMKASQAELDVITAHFDSI